MRFVLCVVLSLFIAVCCS